MNDPVRINAAERFDAAGNLTDGTSRNLIGQLLVSLVEWTHRIGQLRGT